LATFNCLQKHIPYKTVKTGVYVWSSGATGFKQCNGLPVRLLGQASLPTSKIDTAYQYHRTVSKTAPHGARYIV